jgi:hypothetical protein
MLLLGCIAMLSADAKLVSGLAWLRSEDTEWYLGKFSFGAEANGHIAGEFRAHFDAQHKVPRYLDNTPHSLMVALYDDNAWAALERLNQKGALCYERMQLAVAHFPLRSRGTKNAREVITFDYKVPQRPQSHYLYAMLSDCELENYPAHPPGLEYNVTFTNDGSHLPADEGGMLSVLSIVLFITLAGAAAYGWLLRAQQRQYQQVHLASLLLGLAFVLQVIALLSQIAHVRRFAEDGLGFKLRHTWLALDFLSEITQLFSELVVAFVLVCLSAGWTLSDSFHVSRILFDKRAMTLLVLLTGAHLYLQYKGRVYENDFNHFHDYDHWPGMALIGLRTLLCLIFWLGMALSYGVTPEFVRRSRLYVELFTVLGRYSKQQRSAAIASATANVFSPPASSLASPPASGGSFAMFGAGERVRGAGASDSSQQQQQPLMGSASASVPTAAAEGFARNTDPVVASLLRQVLLVGTLWFLAFPLATAGSVFASPAARKVFIVTASLAAHALVLLFLLYCFLCSSSKFFNASSLRNMGTLFSGPGTGNFIRKAALD